MVEPDGLGAVIERSSVPLWERAAELAADGCYPGGLENNRSFLGDGVLADGVSEEEMLPLYDPQTSGGLLIAVAPERAERLTGALADRGDESAVIGEVSAAPALRVRP